ncbi:MAG: nucleotide exchange factor GrpE [Prevotella sp.]|nr:nucleotide exchange factor GrpE [Prevotella sp.]
MDEKKINIEGEEEVNQNAEASEETIVNEETADTETAEESEETAQAEDAAEAEEKDPLEAAQEEIAQLKEQMLYKAAEFDNYRKRTIKEKAELLLNGAEKTVIAVLPVLDDMERAIAEGKKTDDPEVLREGIELIYQKFTKVLESLGVKTIDTTDKDFDVDLHEAIAMVPGMGDDKKGKVIDCVQTGYTLNDKVIRHAKVAVGQ